MPPILAVDESRAEYERGLAHNSHTEEMAVLLLGFTGVIFAGIFAFGLAPSSPQLGPFRTHLVEEALTALAVSAALAALPLVSVFESDVGNAQALLVAALGPALTNEINTAGDYLRRLLFERSRWRTDDFLLDASICSTVDGLVFAVISLVDPPADTWSPVPLSLVIGVTIAAVTAGLLYPRFRKLQDEARRDRGRIQALRLITAAALLDAEHGERKSND
jgi:hypothetical protein